MLLDIVAQEGAKILFKKLDENFNIKPDNVDDLYPDLNNSLVSSYNWAKNIQMFGMISGACTSAQTVQLDFGAPRKFLPANCLHDLSERDLLDESTHTIVLGDPGAGKTTTFKRLVTHYLRRLEDLEHSRNCIPIVIVLREIDENEDLHVIISQSLGIIKHCSQRKDKKHGTYSGQLFLGKTPLRDALPNILDSLDCVVFLDGLDEITSRNRTGIEREITMLSRQLRRSRLFVSCRSGDFVRTMEGFNVVEIKPLDDTQIHEIADRWLSAPENFFEEVKRKNCKELLDRPLTLAQMFIVFERTGYLPDQPSVVYRQLCDLLLREWDEQRRIIRKSAYAKFEREKKFDFLCALAYRLTYHTKVTSFTHKQLVEVYQKICNEHQLPGDQAVQVAGEIETHTGIIVAYSDGKFAFSHLTLQEYLCASYLVREPYASLRRKYLNEYPSPLAVATALSSNPSRWLGFLVLEVGEGILLQSWKRLFDRLEVENPIFSKSPILGIALLKISSECGSGATDFIVRFSRQRGVRDSLKTVLKYYTREASDCDGMVNLKTSPSFPFHIDEYPLPTGGKIPIQFFDLIEN